MSLALYPPAFTVPSNQQSFQRRARYGSEYITVRFNDTVYLTALRLSISLSIWSSTTFISLAFKASINECLQLFGIAKDVLDDFEELMYTEGLVGVIDERIAARSLSVRLSTARLPSMTDCSS